MTESFAAACWKEKRFSTESSESQREVSVAVLGCSSCAVSCLGKRLHRKQAMQRECLSFVSIATPDSLTWLIHQGRVLDQYSAFSSQKTSTSSGRWCVAGRFVLIVTSGRRKYHEDLEVTDGAQHASTYLEKNTKLCYSWVVNTQRCHDHGYRY